MTSGTLETPYGVMEFDKYFVTERTYKKRKDFVVIRTNEVPPLDETFARINRAATLGKRTLRQCDAFLGAKLSQEADVCETGGGCMGSSSNMRFGVELPLAVPDLAEVEELDVKEDGEGLFWLRISARNLDLYADNPAMRNGHSTLGIFIATESPDAANADPNHVRWQYADALLTPTAADLPGALGDVPLRAALTSLRPGTTSV